MEFTNGDAVGNRLTLWDEALVRANRATGRVQLIKVVWVYEHPVDMDAVRRFHRNFGYGMAGRRVERSPLPFGRYRWVSALGPAAPLHINTDPLPREQISDWADQWAQVPIDPETGPGWQMAVQSFTEGVTAISVVGSHCLGDGVAALLAVGTAVAGANIDIGYPPPLSRRTGRAIAADLRETVRGLPEIGRAARKAVKVLRAGGRRRPRLRSRHARRSPTPTNGSSSRRSPPTSIWPSGMPAPRHSAATATRCWRPSAPSWVCGWAGGIRTARCRC